MSKFKTHAVRRDSAQAKVDHIHSLPDGHLTESMLDKPSKDYYSLHTHLYTFEGQTCETEPSMDGPGHTHESELGESSGPIQPQKAPGQPWRKDSLHEAFQGRVQRRGDRWFAISYDGQVVGNHSRQDGAERVLAAWEKTDSELRRA